MKTILLTKEIVYSGSMILVNSQFPYRTREACSRGLLAPITENIELEKQAAAVYLNIVDELGCRERITAVSGWRSQAEQEDIYMNSLRENGADFTRKYVAQPGHSEHQTGLAVDLALNQPDIDFLCPHFPYDGICGEFRKKATRYGFIERYPLGKDGVTGIAHEPWHFRYVGAPHAEIMMGQGLVFEEYHELLREHTYNKPLIFAPDRHRFETYYLRAEEEGQAFTVSHNQPFWVSGNNIDGFVITVM